ncbi:hypothetical protein PVAP13_9NG179273 [Panicum virgatum]|uniref:Uncharacterized protein n=1 Tax=Panicum virgatum TaxID=38727 RepID=A0A8T0MLV1_PANVG|nr:hypothetical protein PVAP13_9NG179273 [Panicum virgatum]
MSGWERSTYAGVSPGCGKSLAEVRCSLFFPPPSTSTYRWKNTAIQRQRPSACSLAWNLSIGPCSDLEVMICREVAGICTIVSKKRELQKQGMSAFILDATKKM